MTERNEQFFSGLSWLLIALVLVSLAVAVSYFRGQDSVNPVISISKAPHQPLKYSVFYRSGVFGPTNIRIHVGDSVKFENNGFTPIRIISDSVAGKLELADFDSKIEIAPNSSYTYTFSKIGIFGYHNYSNDNESGSVIVRPD